MRLDRLQIPAFGPFCDWERDFPPAPVDLHLMYGPNEAGKSSLLRAIRDLFFGVPARSSDVFRHEGKNLRIAATISRRDGKQLAFQRRKGNKNTLLDEQGRELAESALQEFLGGVDARFFSAMFGLGSAELRAGAEELLRGEGVLGNALFSASLGGSPVQTALQQLAAESDRIFRGRSTTQVTLRPAIQQYQELLRQSRDAIVRPEAWEAVELEWQKLATAWQTLQAELGTMETQLDWLNRCRDAWPAVHRLNEEQLHRDSLPQFPPLPSGFLERARKCRSDLQETQREALRCETELAVTQRQLEAVQVPQPLLDRSSEIESLHQDLGSWKKNQKKLREAQLEQAALEQTLADWKHRLGWQGDIEAMDRLNLDSALRLESEEAAEKLLQIESELAESRRLQKEARRDLDLLLREQSALPHSDWPPLREALESAAEASEAWNALPQHSEARNRAAEDVRQRHQQLRGAPTDWNQTGALQLPGKATLRRFRDELRRLDQEIAAEQGRLTEGEHRIESIRLEIDRISRRYELPTREDLLRARAERDAGWEQVLAKLEGREPARTTAGESPPEVVYPLKVSAADEVADRLFRDAATVEQIEEKRQQIAKSTRLNAESAAVLDGLREERRQQEAEWQSLWTGLGIHPLSPDEMEEWLDHWLAFQLALRELREQEALLEQRQSTVDRHRLLLSGLLGAPDDQGLPVLLQAARQKVQVGERVDGQRLELDRRRQLLENRLADLEQDRTSLESEVAEASERWRNVAIRAGLPPDVSPRNGMELLRERKELIRDLGQWKKLAGEMAALLAESGRFEQSARELAAACESPWGPVESVVKSLWSEFCSARDRVAVRQQLQKAADALQGRLASLRAEHRSAMEEQRGLLELMAGSFGELDSLIASLEQVAAADERLAALRTTLGGLARELAVPEFIRKVSEEDAASLTTRREALESGIRRLRQEREALETRRLELGSERKRMESAGSLAVDLVQQSETIASRIGDDARRFLRLRLAIHLMQEQIERFRRENQGPLLEGSGTIFSRITGGVFRGLRAEFNDDDTPVLVAIRAHDAIPVPVAGLSEGTRDQLFLALRLAALERHLEQAEPMPMILDDLLITFDDARARALLPELQRLARQTQVFLFTHHEHVIGLCRETLGDGGFTLHHVHAQGNRS